MPTLSIVVPAKDRDAKDVRQFLSSLQTQTRQPEEVHIITEGNSEEAKAIGIQRSKGDIIGLFCSDNELCDPAFLETMVTEASNPMVIGSYTARYAYIRHDTGLNRYFALIGANDPLCWWLGKADRSSYLQNGSNLPVSHRTFTDRIPTIGDNGFFIKRQAIQLVTKNPSMHFCIDACEDLRRLGYATYAIVQTQATWHKSGETLAGWLLRRYKYCRDLYWKQYGKRRWLMVSGRKDWVRVVGFAVCSLLVLPQVCVSIVGYRRVSDKAWFFHPVACLLLTLVYTYGWIENKISQLLYRLTKDRSR